MRILSESTPRLVRQMLASVGFTLLILMSFVYYGFGYSFAYGGPIRDYPNLPGKQLLLGVMALVILILLGALGPAIIVTNLRRPKKDFWLWSAMPLSMFLIGYSVEVARYGF